MRLRGFLKQIETKGEILHLKDRASTRFEVPLIMKKHDNKGPILLLEELKNYDESRSNVCATRKRNCEV